MRFEKRPAIYHLFAAVLGMALATLPAFASMQVRGPANYASHRLTCEFPIRLTHDCSIWQGATRPIAFGDYRMSLAADSDGRTILLSRVRRGPNHNGNAFRSQTDGPAMSGSAQALQLIGAALEDRGIRLERMRTIHRGTRVAGYFLEFSDNAYDYLKQFTVLESEHWLPGRRKLR